MANKREPVVRYRNELNRTALDLSTNERRIFEICLSKIPFDEEIPDGTTFTITAEEVMSMGAERADAYLALKTAAKSFFHRYVVFSLDDAQNNQIGEQYVHIWSSVRFKDHQGCIELRFSPELMPYIANFKRNYTRYQLVEVNGLKRYALHLYSRLCQFRDTGIVQISLSDFRDRFILNAKYEQYGLLKQKVILPSIKAINKSEHTQFTVSLEEKKVGRKVAVLVFHLTPKDEKEAVKEIEHLKIWSIEDFSMTQRQATLFATRLVGEGLKFAEMRQRAGFTREAVVEALRKLIKGRRVPTGSWTWNEIHFWLVENLQDGNVTKMLNERFLKPLGYKVAKKRKNKTIEEEAEEFALAQKEKKIF